MTLFAVPYRLGKPEKNEAILDCLVKFPIWFAGGTSPDEIRISSARILTDPNNLVWEIWKDGQVVGLLLLTRIVPKVDAVLQFRTFGVPLAAIRGLVIGFLEHCFEQLSLQRVTFEVPISHHAVIKYARESLIFRYEGESRPMAPELVKAYASPQAKGADKRPRVRIAKMGSRREGAYWNGRCFEDVMVLRLLKREFDHDLLTTRGAEPQSASREGESPPDAATARPRTA